jgi:hypothetical protein
MATAGIQDGGGFSNVSASMRRRLQAIRDPSPAMKVWARIIEKETDDAFLKQRSPKGDEWPQLAISTLKSRSRKVKGARSRGKDGKLTKSAQKARLGVLLNRASVTPMVDTARMRNSAHVKVLRASVQWSAVGYTGPHMTGGKNLPKRNVAVFELSGGGWLIVPRVQVRLERVLLNYIVHGKAKERI